MSKFKNIEALGLEVLIAKLQNPNERVVLASDLEALLENGVRVYGHEEYRCIDKLQAESDTHTGFLLNYKPIPKPKPVTKEELIELLHDLKSSMIVVGRLDEEIRQADDTLKRILDAGVE